MGIRILACFIATFATLHAKAASLPAMPPLKLADLTVQAPSTATDPLAAGMESQFRDGRQSVTSTRWLNERQPLTQEQRWVF